MHDVAVVKYEKPLESLRRAVDLAGGLTDVSPGAKVVIKPNFPIWHEGVSFPKYGVYTTARLLEDVVVLLVERGVKDISIVEGMIEIEKSPESMLELAAKGMGLDILSERYGVKIVDVLKGSFARVSSGGLTLSVSRDILAADYVLNMPVLKTHAQAMVSLGMKNLKGVLNMASRKKCHNADPSIDLDYHISRLPEMLPPSLTIIDGIYSLERGPVYTGKAHRSDIIVASKDLLSADKVGAAILGIAPQTVPYLVFAAGKDGRPADLSDVRVRGEVDVETALKPHEWDLGQTEAGDMPLFLERAGIRGMTYPRVDNTMCTYCSAFIYDVLTGIMLAKNKDRPFDDIEVLHGKVHEPTAGHKHTLLIGQCQVKKNRDNPLIDHCVTIKGCPPNKSTLPKAYQALGIELPDDFAAWMEKMPETFAGRYLGRPEFDEAFYRIDQTGS